MWAFVLLYCTCEALEAGLFKAQKQVERQRCENDSEHEKNDKKGVHGSVSAGANLFARKDTIGGWRKNFNSPEPPYTEVTTSSRLPARRRHGLALP